MSALGYDPVPGDVDAVARVAALLGAVAGQAETVTTRLARLDSGVGPQVWRGPAADAFRSMLAGVGPDVIKLVGAHREAEDALRTYASALGAAQGSARQAEHDAATAIADRDRAECERRRAAEEIAAHRSRINECRVRIGQAQVARLTALTDPVYQAEMDRYESQVRGIQQHAETGAAQARSRDDSARTAGSAAEARVEAARLLARQATEIRDHAARRAVDRLDAAGQVGARRSNPIKGFLGAVDDKLRSITAHPDFAAWMQRLSDIGGILFSVGKIVAILPIPGAHLVAGVLLGAGVIFKGVALGGTLLAGRYGNASGADIAYRGIDATLTIFGGSSAMKSAGIAKRALHFHDARSARDAWRLVHAAARPSGKHLHPILGPTRYFRSYSTLVGTTTVTSLLDVKASWDRLQKPIPQRGSIPDLVVPVVTGRIGGGVAGRVAGPVWGSVTEDVTGIVVGETQERVTR